jgi:hypothetical protein
MEPHALLVDALGRSLENSLHALDGLSADELAWRPGPSANPIGWLVWHLARVQDDHVAFVAGLEQVWTAQGYAADLDLPLDDGDIGYGHSAEQVASVRAEAPRLAAYVEAVTRQSTAWLERGGHDWDRVVDDRWDPPVTLAVRLVSVVDDCAQHAGQAGYVRGLLDAGAGTSR